MNDNEKKLQTKECFTLHPHRISEEKQLDVHVFMVREINTFWNSFVIVIMCLCFVFMFMFIGKMFRDILYKLLLMITESFTIVTQKFLLEHPIIIFSNILKRDFISFIVQSNFSVWIDSKTIW